MAKISKIVPLTLSSLGTFVAENDLAYEDRISSILSSFVELEPPRPKKAKSKKTRLLSEMKNIFRREHILAQKDEGLDSHRVVVGVELADGLVADMVLRNGRYNVIETVDASEEYSVRRIVADIAVSALVLERARMQFDDGGINSKLVYVASSSLEAAAKPSLDAAAHQGAELVNWASNIDRSKFVQAIASLATPVERKRNGKFVKSTTRGLFH